ncbi:hypothetical protein P9112_005502 [Eukaryota sp. TZLM1-RC]
MHPRPPSRRPQSARNPYTQRYPRPRPASASAQPSKPSNPHAHLNQDYVVLNSDSPSTIPSLDSRKMPNNLLKDPEALYEENLYLKQEKNELFSQLSALKTRAVRAEQTLSKTKRELGEVIKRKTLADAATLGLDCLRNDTSLVERLRDEAARLSSELKSKEVMIDSLKKESRTTRVNELEAQLSNFVGEVQRLRSILVEFGIDASTGRRIEKKDPSREMIKELKEQKQILESEIQELKAEIVKIKVLNSGESADLEVLRSQNEELKNKIVHLEEQLKEAPLLRRQVHEQSMNEVEKLKEALKDKDHELEVSKLNQSQGTSELKGQIKELEAKVAESKNSYDKEKERRGMAEKRSRDLELEMGSMKDQVENLKIQNQILNDGKLLLEEEVGKLKRANSELVEENQRLECQIQIEHAKSDSASIRSESVSVDRLNNEVEESKMDIEEQIDQNNQDISGIMDLSLTADETTPRDSIKNDEFVIESPEPPTPLDSAFVNDVGNSDSLMVSDGEL